VEAERRNLVLMVVVYEDRASFLKSAGSPNHGVNYVRITLGI
jgi:hypothetical protein